MDTIIDKLETDSEADGDIEEEDAAMLDDMLQLEEVEVEMDALVLDQEVDIEDEVAGTLDVSEKAIEEEEWLELEVEGVEGMETLLDTELVVDVDVVVVSTFPT